MKFPCIKCNRLFLSERICNTHLLFEHGIFKPECTNWKAIDQRELQNQRMFVQANDIIHAMETKIKTTLKTHYIKRDKMVGDNIWQYDWILNESRTEINELIKLMEQLIKNDYKLPKMSNTLKLLMVNYL